MKRCTPRRNRAFPKGPFSSLTEKSNLADKDSASQSVEIPQLASDSECLQFQSKYLDLGKCMYDLRE